MPWDDVLEVLFKYSRFVVRIQRKVDDPKRQKMSSDKKGGSGTGVYVYAGEHFSGISCASTSSAMLTSSSRFAEGNEFISQSDPRAFQKLKFDLQNRNFILTNNHVILSEFEAQSACLDFFFDEPGQGTVPPKRLVRVKVTGMYPLYSPRVGPGKAADSEHLDFCLLTFNIAAAPGEDKKRWRDIDGLALIHNEDYPTPKKNDILVCFGHPHGKSKRLSTGVILESTEDEHAFEVQYYLPTCPGSSGGYIYCVAFRDTKCYCYPKYLHFIGVHTQSEKPEYLHGRGIVLQNVQGQISSWFHSARKKTASQKP